MLQIVKHIINGVVNMVNLNSYKGGELQNFLALFNQFETAGVIEIRFVREKIEEHLHSRLLQHRKHYVKEKRKEKKKYAQLSKCPFCEKNTMLQVPNDENLIIFECRKCLYSKIMEVSNVS